MVMSTGLILITGSNKNLEKTKKFVKLMEVESKKTCEQDVLYSHSPRPMHVSMYVIFTRPEHLRGTIGTKVIRMKIELRIFLVLGIVWVMYLH